MTPAMILLCRQVFRTGWPTQCRQRRGLLIVAGLALGIVGGVGVCSHSGAGEREKQKVVLPGPSDATPVVRTLPAARKPADFKSLHFLIHTDLGAKQAHELLNRLEVMLGLISKYWGQPPRGVIECYVVADLSVWPAGSLDPAGRAKIQEKAGVTLVETQRRGDRPVAATAVVYASAEYGNPQHEAVHAYCGQTFGQMGPLWYAEGMAEMGQYWRQNDRGVHCHPFVVKYIRSSPPKPLQEILGDRAQSMTGDCWQNYAWRWALCHLLENNSNYAPRFRALGLGFLTGQKQGFGDVYAPMLNEIAFEYRFFVGHVDEGYRVDLCSWDWKHKFKEPTAGTPASAHVTAQRGWQPSGAIVLAGRTYSYGAKGTWKTSKDGPDLTADGQPDGTGRLEGVIFNEFVLSEPFSLGAEGTFSPPREGRLYLRCRDRWNELADNKGSMTVRISTNDAAPASDPNAGEPGPKIAEGR